MSLRFDSFGADLGRARDKWLRGAEGEEPAAPVAARRISVFGLCYVGSVSLACLARDGHEMVGVDIDPGKLELLRRGQAPIVETGIQALTRAVTLGGAVTVTDSVRTAILGTDVSFVCVGTPARQNGNQDLRAIVRIAQQIGAVLPEKCSRHLIVVRSTVKPGTVEEIIRPME